ncbi:MAG: hypothetical protein WCG91_02610 [Candidatus Shapirobacteria bacterium]
MKGLSVSFSWGEKMTAIVNSSTKDTTITGKDICDFIFEELKRMECEHEEETLIRDCHVSILSQEITINTSYSQLLTLGDLNFEELDDYFWKDEIIELTPNLVNWVVARIEEFIQKPFYFVSLESIKPEKELSGKRLYLKDITIVTPGTFFFIITENPTRRVYLTVTEDNDIIFSKKSIIIDTKDELAIVKLCRCSQQEFDDNLKENS